VTNGRSSGRGSRSRNDCTAKALSLIASVRLPVCRVVVTVGGEAADPFNTRQRGLPSLRT
jgi:hypothetical protein